MDFRYLWMPWKASGKQDREVQPFCYSLFAINGKISGDIMTKYFIDTEFIEDGRVIDLVSIGIVADDGREYYAISTEFNESKASDWVKENVFSKLPPCNPLPTEVSPRIWEESRAWKDKETIKHEVAEFLGCNTDTVYFIRNGLLGLFDHFILRHFPSFAKREVRFELKEWVETPEFWAYYADYDWVVFCQLFGRMMDLPKGFPKYCRDIKQWCDQLGNPKLPEKGKGTHNAIADARWNKQAWEFLRQYKEDCVVTK